VLRDGPHVRPLRPPKHDPRVRAALGGAAVSTSPLSGLRSLEPSSDITKSRSVSSVPFCANTRHSPTLRSWSSSAARGKSHEQADLLGMPVHRGGRRLVPGFHVCFRAPTRNRSAARLVASAAPRSRPPIAFRAQYAAPVCAGQRFWVQPGLRDGAGRVFAPLNAGCVHPYFGRATHKSKWPPSLSRTSAERLVAAEVTRVPVFLPVITFDVRRNRRTHVGARRGGRQFC